jgi:hypothetical protein
MGLINLITNPEDFKFYSGGIGSTSTTYRFGQKSIPFQKDRIYGGKSKQPYIISPIKEPGQFSNFYGDSDFLWAGGVLGTLKASEDSSRLLKYFSDTSNISGNFFIQKQELLSKINPKTEISLKDEPNGGIYLSDSTIFQSQKGFQGFHFLKQGNPSLIDQEVNRYQNHFSNQTVETYIDSNRLIQLTNSTKTRKTNNEDFNNISQYKIFPNFSTLISYGGGPGSNNGEGFTNIKFATDINGIAINSILGPQFTQIGKPLDQIDQDKFQLPIGASKKYFDFDSNIPITSSNTGQTDFLTNSGNTNSWGYNFIPSVYELGSIKLNSITTDKKYLTITDPSILFTRTSLQVISFNPKSVSTTFNDNSPLDILDVPVYDSTKNQYVFKQDSKIQGDYNSDSSLTFYQTSPYKDKNKQKTLTDFRKKSRNDRGFQDTGNEYDKITDSSDYSKNTLDKIYYDSSSDRTSNAFNSAKDLINFEIFIVNGTNQKETKLKFKAYINDFSDDYSANWATQTYMGRGEEFYRYNKFSRNIGLSFTAIADNKENLQTMYAQLNTLASSLAPSYTTEGYMSGNLHRLTVGNYIKKQYGILTGLTFTIPEDSPWEIESGKQLSHYIEVSGLKFNVIHDFRPNYNASLKYLYQT